MMIKYEGIETSNWFTEGFELSLPGPMEILLTAGNAQLNNEKYEYPEIEFDIEADPELSVNYTVYLLSEPGSDGNLVHIDRNELGQYTGPTYEGDGQILHVLMSFKVPPGTEDLNTIDLVVRNVIMEEVIADEIPTE